jgi:hypothetical protein
MIASNNRAIEMQTRSYQGWRVDRVAAKLLAVANAFD